ncbi:hypothetical protein [Salibacterium aidingense]|uniref:hypothetical protein n=1 Tax=Salibacterium aidingense TaxID=384933 RepID=UPI000687F14A|nr:hypothetical protein [Salibacterium aidingense]
MRFLFTLVILLPLVGCNLDTKTVAEFYEQDLSEVTKIVITNGNTGFEKTVTYNGDIESFLSDIKEVKFIPDENQENRSGFNYLITLFEDGEKTVQFGLTKVQGNYYHTEPDIYPIVDDFYKNLDVEKQ